MSTLTFNYLSYSTIWSFVSHCSISKIYTIIRNWLDKVLSCTIPTTIFSLFHIILTLCLTVKFWKNNYKARNTIAITLDHKYSLDSFLIKYYATAFHTLLPFMISVMCDFYITFPFTKNVSDKSDTKPKWIPLPFK